MKKRYLMIVVILLLAVSCDEPVTVVTDIVHSDGSVRRKIEMRNSENKFKISNVQIPFDSTWAIRDSVEINAKGDTTWVKRAEKHFRSADDINLTYMSDSSANRHTERKSEFNKSFRWFSTAFRFSERIEKKLEFGYPVKDFLNDEELHFFYSPDQVKNEMQNGPDSLRYRALNDTVSSKTDKWATKSLVSEWIGQFGKLVAEKGASPINFDSLKLRENEMARYVEQNDNKFDSLWKAGVILEKFIGKANTLKYQTEADSAISIVTESFLVDFKDYSVRIAMPGNVTSTNGFIDSSKMLLWPVKSDFFITEPYEMYAESRVPNMWAWIVSGLFLVFVLTGVIVKVIKKG